MARYLPAAYRAIADAEIVDGSNLLTYLRTIARNQNWAWANLGGVFAADGQKSLSTKNAQVVGASQSIEVGRFTAPAVSRTTSAYYIYRGLYTISGVTTTVACRVRFYQLLAGETDPSTNTPYDEVVIVGTGTDVAINLTAIRARSRRIVVYLVTDGSNTSTLELVTCSAMWDAPLNGDLGVTFPTSWSAISQGYVAANRPLSIALVRQLARQTHFLVAHRRPLLYSHSFIWPHLRSDALGSGRLAIYRVTPDSIANKVTVRFSVTMTGQNAVGVVQLRVNGATVWTSGNTTATAVVSGVYISTTEFTSASVTLTAGDVASTVELVGVISTAATEGSSYDVTMGMALNRVQVTQDQPSAADLGLPGADTIPAAYQPLDDGALDVDRPVVAQNDKLGNRAGPYYLVKNLIWLAGNRGGQSLVADWCGRSQNGYMNGTRGDALYRRATVSLGAIAYAQGPGTFPTNHGANGITGWVDRANPTDNRAIPTGHHYLGTVLGEYHCIPVTGGVLRVAGRFYHWDPVAEDPPLAQVRVEYPSATNKFDFNLDAVDGDTAPNDYVLPSLLTSIAGDNKLRLQGAINPTAASYTPQHFSEVACDGAYIYELPLTQTDLNALA